MSAIPTRVFNNGNSQAVRIPAEYRLDTDRVLISRNADGDLVVHPIREPRGTALMATLGALAEVDAAFILALDDDRKDALAVQEREDL